MPNPSQLLRFHQPFDGQALIAGPLHLDTTRNRLTLTVPLAVIEELDPDIDPVKPDLEREIVEGWLGVRTWDRGLFVVTSVLQVGYPTGAPAKAWPYIGAAMANLPPQLRVLLAVAPWSPAR